MKPINKEIIIIDDTGTKFIISISCVESNHPAKRYDTLEIVNNPICLSITGKYKKCFGQIVDDIVPRTKAQKSFVRYWKKYHLNDVHNGTKNQEAILKIRKFKGDYNEACTLLEKYNLLVDRGHKYGAGFLYKPISVSNLFNLIRLLKNEQQCN